jgi:hypothetical protein
MGEGTRPRSRPPCIAVTSPQRQTGGGGELRNNREEKLSTGTVPDM